MLDHPVLAGGVAALKEDEDAVAARDQAALKLDQLDLQLVQVTAIVVLDRIAARGRIGRWAWRPVWHLPQRSVAMYSIRSSIPLAPDPGPASEDADAKGRSANDRRSASRGPQR